MWAAALGLVGMFFVSHIPYHFWERFAVIGYVVSLILIVLVLSPLGVDVNGARRWLNLGMSIQPAAQTISIAPSAIFSSSGSGCCVKE